jgi:hypothetical protein
MRTSSVSTMLTAVALLLAQGPVAAQPAPIRIAAIEPLTGGVAVFG